LGRPKCSIDLCSGSHSFFICTTLSGVGLVAWEFIQLTGDRLVFDFHDISATGIGLFVSGLLFFALPPKTMDDEIQS
jgi:hypothetical protein